MADPDKKKSKRAHRKTKIRQQPTLMTVEDYEEDGTQVEDATPQKIKKRGSARMRRPQSLDTPQAKHQLQRFALSMEGKGMNAIFQEFLAIKASTTMLPLKTAFDAHPDKNRYRGIFFFGILVSF